jgi:hypothetical protein
VSISIYNVSGQLVERILNEDREAGNHSIPWRAQGMSSGIYFYKIEAGEYTAVKKCIILK